MAKELSATVETNDAQNEVNPINGVPLLVIGETSNSTPKPKESSPRTRLISESSNHEYQSNGKLHEHHCVNHDDNAFVDVDDNTLSILPDNDFQSMFSINEGYNVKDCNTIVEYLPVPPDGGYGWVVVSAAFLCNFIVDGISNAFGPFMASYQQTFGASKAAVSLVGSLLIGMYLLCGPIAGALLNNYEARKVVIVGTILASTSFFLSTFSPNIYVHYLLYGFLGGIGFGFIYLPAIVIVSQYFETKRALATGFAVAGSGFGTFIIPLFAKFLIGSFGWKIALYGLAALVLLCLFCACLFRPLPIPAIDLEKQHKLNKEMKQQALLAALSRADGEDESRSNISDGGITAGGVSPVKRSATTRTSSQCTKEDGQPLLSGMEMDGTTPKEDNNVVSTDDGNILSPSPPATPHRPPLSPILEGGPRRLSKSRASSQHHQHQQSHVDGVAGRHPTGVSISRTRKPTLTSMISDSWMGSSNQLRRSHANLNSQLSRVSARSYAQSLSRISQAPVQSIKAGESILSVATSGVEPSDFSRPLSRHDIFLQGSIRNLREFESEGGNYQRYRESQISIPISVAAQNLSTSFLHVPGANSSDLVEFGGGNRFGRIGGEFGVTDFEEYELQPDDSKFKWIPLPVRQAFSEMISPSLLADPVMVLLCISNILGMLGFYVPFVFLIELAISRGATLSEATFLLSIIGISNTFGRVFFGWMADRRWVTALTITNCSLICCGLLTIFCPFLPNYPMLIAYAGLFGFIVAAYVCLTSILLSDLLGVERLTNSFGILVVARGIASLLGTPIAGVVFDLSQSYSAAFYFAGFLILLAGLVSCAVSALHKYQRSQLRNEGEYTEPGKKIAPATAITTIAEQQPAADAQSGKLSVLTERSEENLTEYQRTIQSIKQQRALLQELEQYKQRRDVVEEDCREDSNVVGEEAATTTEIIGTHSADTPAVKKIED